MTHSKFLLSFLCKFCIGIFHFYWNAQNFIKNALVFKAKWSYYLKANSKTKLKRLNSFFFLWMFLGGATAPLPLRVALPDTWYFAVSFFLTTIFVRFKRRESYNLVNNDFFKLQKAMRKLTSFKFLLCTISLQTIVCNWNKQKYYFSLSKF